jgi:hypothetical protein
LTAFKEIWSETIRHVHAMLADAEIVRYTRPDGTTMWVESVSIGLIEPLKKVHHVEVYGTTEEGEHVEDRFLAGAGEVPDEISQLLYPAELARLMSAVIEADEEPRASGQSQTRSSRAPTSTAPSSPGCGSATRT